MIICIAGKNNIAVNGLNEFYKLKNDYNNIELGVLYNRSETGENGWQKSLKKRARELGVKEYSLEEIYSEKDLIFISLEFDRIVDPKKFLTNRIYNIHFSLLPKYRGMYTSAWPILKGEKKSGVTLHKIDRGIDTGDIIDQIEFKLKDTETARSLYLKYNDYALVLLKRNLKKLIKIEQLDVEKQNEIHSTYYSKDTLDYKNIVINLKQSAEKINAGLRAYNFREYQLPKVFGYSILDSKITNRKSTSTPGTLLEENTEMLIIATMDYDLILYKDRFEILMLACKNGNLSLVKEICRIRKHINEQNDEGMTPIILAAKYNQLEIVKYLEYIGASTEIVDFKELSYLDYLKLIR